MNSIVEQSGAAILGVFPRLSRGTVNRGSIYINLLIKHLFTGDGIEAR